MDSRLEVKDQKRLTTRAFQPDLPLVSLAWRALRAAHQRQAVPRQLAQAEHQRLIKALVGIAEELVRLKMVFRTPELEIDSKAACDVISRRMETTLDEADVNIYMPIGEVYDDTIVAYVDSVAQQHSLSINKPIVKEMISPAIFYKGELILRGRAVIEVPSEPSNHLDIENPGGNHG